MALLPCYECGTAISTEANSGPHCGAPNRMKVTQPITKEKPRTRPIFKLLAGMLLILFVVVLFSKNDAPAPEMKAEEQSISANAEKLAADYKNNEVAADERYKGKKLIVAGVVQSINKDYKGEVWIGLKTNNQFMPIHAVGLSARQAGMLAKGEVIAIVCTGDGMILGSPFLKDCRSPKKNTG